MLPSCMYCQKSFKYESEVKTHVKRVHQSTENTIECSFKDCSVLLKSPGSFKAHVLGKHLARRTYVCYACEKKFSSLSGLTRHKLSHSGERSFKCSLCPFDTMDPIILKRHLTRHTGNKEIECESCERKFYELGARNVHYKRVHLKVRPIRCDSCDNFATDSKRDLLRHMSGKHGSGEKSFKCDQGDKYFVDQFNLRRHQRSHGGGKLHACNICQKPFPTKKRLQIHSSVHTDEKPFPCKICPRTFSQNSNLYTHVKKCHFTGEKSIPCTLCYMTFTSGAALKRHQNIHIAKTAHIKGTSHLCKICLKESSTEDTLRVHTRIHSGEKSFSCQFCPRTFSQSSNLYTHVREAHNPIGELFSCAICKKTTTSARSLKVHQIIHTKDGLHSNEKKYPCTICNKHFSWKMSLTRHYKCHVTEKPVCEICRKEYSCKAHLNVHKRLHNGEKPFSCKFCLKTFSQSVQVLTHVGKHCTTGEKSISCNFCPKTFASETSLKRHKMIHSISVIFPSRSETSSANLDEINACDEENRGLDWRVEMLESTKAIKTLPIEEMEVETKKAMAEFRLKDQEK